MAKKTAAEKLWKIQRKRILAQKQEELGSGRRFEVIAGKRFEYPCYAKGHEHVIDCCTPEMWDAASEEVYADAKR